MAYIKELWRPECLDCFPRKAATHAVYNAKNTMNGEYCKRHAEERCRRLSALEDSYRDRP